MGKHTDVGLTRCGASSSTSQKGVCLSNKPCGNVMECNDRTSFPYHT